MAKSPPAGHDALARQTPLPAPDRAVILDTGGIVFNVSPAEMPENEELRAEYLAILSAAPPRRCVGPDLLQLRGQNRHHETQR